MFGNYIRAMPKISGADRKTSAKGSGSTPDILPKHSKGLSGSGKATAGTRCQKCEKFGHFTYNCPTKNAPYKSRPTRTQQLTNPKVKRDTPTVEVPQEFLSKKGIAAKILEQKEQERSELGGVSASKSQKVIKKKSSASDSETSSISSTSDSSSDSDSDGDSESSVSSSSSSSSASPSSDASRSKHKGREYKDHLRSPVRRRHRSYSSSSRDSDRPGSRKRTRTAPTHSGQKRQRSRSRSPSTQSSNDDRERRSQIRAGKQREVRDD